MKLDTLTHRGLTIEIHHDEWPSSPREDDCLGTIVAWHRRYSLSDKDAPDTSEAHGIRPRDFKPEDYPVCLPVYLFDHSGLALSTTPFHCPWDSGQVGWIYVTEDKLKREYGAVTVATVEHAREVLKGEVEIYGAYLAGEVYGFVIKDEDGEHLDSCWGFIKDEHYCVKCAKEAVDAEWERRYRKADAMILPYLSVN